MIDEKQIQELIKKYSNEHDRLVRKMEAETDIQAALHLSGSTKIYGRVISDLTNLLKQNQ